MRDFVFVVIGIFTTYGAGYAAGRRSIRSKFDRLLSGKRGGR